MEKAKKGFPMISKGKKQIKFSAKKVPQANLSQVVPSTVALMLFHQQATSKQKEEQRNIEILNII
jgi:hypothetical protein